MEAEIVNSVQENTGNIWVIVSTVAAAISAVFAAVAAGISLWQVKQISKQRDEEQQQNKLEMTIQFNPFTNLEYMRSNKILMSGISPMKNDPQITEDQMKMLNDDIALMQHYSFVFAYLNQIAIAYEEELLDRKLAFRMFGQAVNGFVEFFKPMILKYRKSENVPAIMRLHDEWKKK